MAAKDDILTYKHNIPALKTPTNGAMLVDKLFENFIEYAGDNWKYAAQQGAQTAENALDGTGLKTLACATIRKAFKLMLSNSLGVPSNNEDINDYFVTQPGLKCFDPSVTGNLGNYRTGIYNLGCHFSTHYFLSCNDKFYDPCLTATYHSKEGPVASRTTLIMTTDSPPKTVRGLRKAGTGPTLVFFRLVDGHAVPGFGSVWEIIKPAELKSAISAEDYKTALNDPVVKASGLR